MSILGKSSVASIRYAISSVPLLHLLPFLPPFLRPSHLSSLVCHPCMPSSSSACFPADSLSHHLCCLFSCPCLPHFPTTSLASSLPCFHLFRPRSVSFLHPASLTISLCLLSFPLSFPSFPSLSYLLPVSYLLLATLLLPSLPPCFPLSSIITCRHKRSDNGWFYASYEDLVSSWSCFYVCILKPMKLLLCFLTAIDLRHAKLLRFHYQDGVNVTHCMLWTLYYSLWIERMTICFYEHWSTMQLSRI